MTTSVPLRVDHDRWRIYHHRVTLPTLKIEWTNLINMQPAPDYWRKACQTLAQSDPIMAALIARFNGSLCSDSSAFEVLSRAVVGQQISVKAADKIWQRLSDKLPEITPAAVARRRRDVLKRCGLSASKTEYLKNIAAFFVDEGIEQRYWRQDPETIRARLTSIKGVGHWTYEMFAIFFLRQPDIFPIGDLGLINAIKRQYKDGASLTMDEIVALGERWAPWRTVATWYLWRSIDGDPVAY